MSRSYPSMPTQAGGYAPYLPPHLGYESQHFTDSTGSQESLMTQPPLPYYLPQDHPQYHTQPQLLHPATMAPSPRTELSASSLNPASGSFVPSGFPPPLPTPSSQAALQSTGMASGSQYATTPLTSSIRSFDSQSTYQSQTFSNGAIYGRDSFSSASSYPAEQSGPRYGGPHFQVAGMPMYPPPPGAVSSPPTGYQGGYMGHPMMGMGPAPPNYPHMYGAHMGPASPGYASMYNSPDHYGHHGAAPVPMIGTTTFNPYAHVPGQMGNHGSALVASPTMSYSTAYSPISNPSAMVYNNNEYRGVSQAWGSLEQNGYGGNTVPGQQPFEQSTSNGNGSYSNKYNPAPSRGSHGGTSNNNQGQNKSSKGKQAFGSQNNPRPSGRANKGKGKAKEGAATVPVHTARSIASSPERREMSRVSQRSAASRPSMTSDKLAISHFAPQETKARSVDACTPGPKPHVPFSECKSEPRGVGFATPQLRTVRGLSISSQSNAVVATEPVCNNEKSRSVANWLESTPTNNVQNSLSLEEATETIKRHQQQSPPKMPSLFGQGAGGGTMTSTLKLMNENDPFVTRRPPVGVLAIRGPLNGQHGTMSRQLALLTHGGTKKPSIEEALDQKNLPFVEYCRTAKADDFGVIRIKNIPYSVNRPEVLAFLGRNARIVDERYNEPVHIIMERVTSKTLDCFVEFINFDEAVSAVQRFEQNRSGGRGGRLGQRHVDVELSSQAELMKELFPKAKNVVWHGSKPEILPKDPYDKYNSGFQGFVSREELVMLVKHVEAPQRSPFAKECPQRPFECLISTLIKFPWYMVDFISLEDRHHLHKATIELLTLLVERINNGDGQDTHLTSMLLKRVWKAALRCPGFSPIMKDDIVFIAKLDEQTAREHGHAPFADLWGKLFTIGPKADAPHDLILWYIAIIREATESRQPKPTLAEQAANGEGEGKKKRKLFGELELYINHEKGFHSDTTLCQVAQAEWAAIEHVLRMALTPALEG